MRVVLEPKGTQSRGWKKAVSQLLSSITPGPNQRTTAESIKQDSGRPHPEPGLKQFTRFVELPPELRLNIINLALAMPRVVIVECGSRHASRKHISADGLCTYIAIVPTLDIH